VLAQLAEKEGSSQAVAALLNVPERTLQRWSLGRAQMPLRAFLRALNLVVEHELRAGPPPEAGKGPERLTFRAGTVLAECAKCQCTEFRRRDAAEPLTYRSVLACTGCAAEVVHSDLIAALARRVAMLAGSYVERAKVRAARRPRVRTE
jgi:hypothetical protein